MFLTQRCFAKHVMQSGYLRISLVNSVEKRFATGEVTNAEGVACFENGIELFKFVLGIRKTLTKRFRRNRRARCYVAQCAHFFLCVVADYRVTCLLGNKWIVVLKFLQLLFENRNYRCLLLHEIAFLFWVSNYIIKFGFRSFDVVITAGFQRMERTPAKRTERIEGLTVGCVVIRLLLPEQRG